MSELDHIISIFTFVVSGIYFTDTFLLFGATFSSVKSNITLPNGKFIFEFSTTSSIIIWVGLVCTVTIHWSFFPLSVFTVIIVVPFLYPVTKPSSLTSAISGLLLIHVNFVSVWFASDDSVAFNWIVFVLEPKSIIALLILKLIDFITSLYLSVTFILHVAVLVFVTSPLFTSTLASITAVPFEIPFTITFLSVVSFVSIWTTLSLLDFHFIVEVTLEPTIASISCFESISNVGIELGFIAITASSVISSLSKIVPSSKTVYVFPVLLNVTSYTVP